MKRVELFECVTIRFSGMRGLYEYEILPLGEKAQVSKYDIRYAEGEEQRVLARQGTCGMEEMLRRMNKCRFLSWDGFYGKHPRRIRDGLMFRLTASVNGGGTVSAGGSQNFPRHFRDFTHFLYEVLQRGK